MNNADRLIADYLAGTLDAQGLDDLGAYLRASPANADHFALEVTLHRAIRDRLQARREVPARGPWRISQHKMLALAAALTISLLAGLAYHLTQKLQSPASAAGVEATVDATWNSPVSVSLPPGRHSLLTGVARLSLPDHTDAYIRAPATFRLASNAFELLSGQATFAHSSPTATPSTLAVIAANSHLVATGTEFAVDSQSAASATLRVLAGQVQVDNSARPVSAGETVALGVAGNSTSLARPLRPAEFALLQSAAGSTWSRRRLSLLEDPTLLLYADLAAGSSPAINALGSALPAPLTSLTNSLPPTTAGRVAGGTALSFSSTSAALRTHIPGDFTSLTLAAWVRLNPEDLSRNRHRGLLMADGWGQPGLVHWQLKGNGFRLSFFDKGDGEDPRFTASSDALWDGRWHLLTTTISLQTSTVTHYLDGIRIARASFASANLKSLRLGPTSIGGWSPTPNDSDPDRHLNGAMGEILVFSRALSAGEINQLFADSKTQP